MEIVWSLCFSHNHSANNEARRYSLWPLHIFSQLSSVIRFKSSLLSSITQHLPRLDMLDLISRTYFIALATHNAAIQAGIDSLKNPVCLVITIEMSIGNGQHGCRTYIFIRAHIEHGTSCIANTAASAVDHIIDLRRRSRIKVVNLFLFHRLEADTLVLFLKHVIEITAIHNQVSDDPHSAQWFNRMIGICQRRTACQDRLSIQHY